MPCVLPAHVATGIESPCLPFGKQFGAHHRALRQPFKAQCSRRMGRHAGADQFRLRTTAERLSIAGTQHTEQQEQQQAPDQEPFNWQRQWYPLAFIEDLDPGRPHAAELLGKRLVLWRDSQQQWRALEDRCPHRLAPLSEGRIEESDGSLMCSYHGWRFNGEGTCTRIPQALEPKAEATACSSSRACAAAFPTQVRQGYLWVWGDSGALAPLQAAAKPPLLIPNIREDDIHQTTDGGPVLSGAHRYMRDVPYSWDVLVENLLDPSHVCYAHHDVQGNRYAELGGHIEISPTDPSDPLYPRQPDAISMDVRSAAFGKRLTDFKIQFLPPCFVLYYIPSPLGGKVKWSQMPMYVVPTGPGRGRVLWWLCIEAANLPAPFKLLAGLKPKWLEHVKTRNLVFEGDNIILHQQEKMLAADGQEGRSWKQAFFMPMPADKMVTAFRQWYDRRAGGGPVPRPAAVADLAEGGPFGEPDREALLDRYNAHTKNCPACMRALRTAQLLHWVAGGAGALAAMACAYLAGSPARPPVLLLAGLCALAAACAAAVPWLNGLVQQFYFVDYVHQDKK